MSIDEGVSMVVGVVIGGFLVGLIWSLRLWWKGYKIELFEQFINREFTHTVFGSKSSIQKMATDMKNLEYTVRALERQLKKKGSKR